MGRENFSEGGHKEICPFRGKGILRMLQYQGPPEMGSLKDGIEGEKVLSEIPGRWRVPKGREIFGGTSENLFGPQLPQKGHGQPFEGRGMLLPEKFSKGGFFRIPGGKIFEEHLQGSPALPFGGAAPQKQESLGIHNLIELGA